MAPPKDWIITVKNIGWKMTAIAVVLAGTSLASCGGSGSSSSGDSSPAKRVKNAALSDPWATPCASGGGCRIGDIGPGGGVVVYSGDKVLNAVPDVSDGGVYLEFFDMTSLDPQATYIHYYTFGCEKSVREISGADGIVVGTGAQNTKDIVAACKETNISSYMALNTTQGGKSDWFVPSQGELDLVCQYVHGQVPTASDKSICDKTKSVISPLPNNWGTSSFWSSTESTPGWARQNEPGRVIEKGTQRDSKLSQGVMRAFGAYAGPAPATTTTTIPPTCALGGICKVGDVGPGGGTVFYVGTTKIDEYGAKYPGGKYLEFVDPNKTSQYKCNTHINDTSDALGSGAKNTALYKASCTTSGVPVDAATNATNGGKSDWFIPSLNELLQICRYSRGQAAGTDNSCSNSKVTVGNANLSKAQWSSTQYSEQSMWGVSMGDGTTIKRDKNKYNYNYLLVRAFG